MLSKIVTYYYIFTNKSSNKIQAPSNNEGISLVEESPYTKKMAS